MVEILCEEIHLESKNNVDIIYTYIDAITLHETMVFCYMQRKHNDAEIAELACDTAIKTHNLLKHMEDFKGIRVG